MGAGNESNRIGRSLSRRLVLGETLYRLGLRNVATVAAYRVALKSGLLERSMAVRPLPPGPYFPTELRVDRRDWVSEEDKTRIVHLADEVLDGRLRYFSGEAVEVGSPPDWFSDPYTGQRFPDPDVHWSKVREFSTAGFDIKVIWEPSRFAWSPLLAQGYLLTGDRKYLGALNTWYSEWADKNPVSQGPNWKCGQETAIRLLNALLTWDLLSRHATEPGVSPSQSLTRFVEEHCRRIDTTYAYARAQDNNHAITEAAGLFVGGAWLASSIESEVGRRWLSKGRRRLEERVAHLVMDDGSFSQYSSNYHRLLLDVLSLVEVFRQRLQLPPFSDDYEHKAQKATRWLYEFVDELSGDAPNLGANDGALLFDLNHLGYRDFRSTLQRAAVALCDSSALPEGPWDGSWRWVGLNKPQKSLPPRQQATLFREGGYAILRHPTIDSWLLLRFPAFRFRPGHADLLHLDVWHRGDNVLLDGGSFSYAAGGEKQQAFTGIAGHNTVQVGGSEPMLGLGRFLWGRWPEALGVELNETTAGRVGVVAGYRHPTGETHLRRVTPEEWGWRVVDVLSGLTEEATLRWRMMPGDWTAGTISVSCLSTELHVTSEAVVSTRLVDGFASSHYLELRRIPVLEATLGGREAQVCTEIRLT